MSIQTKSTDSQTFGFQILTLGILWGVSYAHVLDNALVPCSKENGGVLYKFTQNTSYTKVDLGFSFQYSTETYTSVFINPRGLLEFRQANGDKSVYSCGLNTDFAVPTIALLADIYNNSAVGTPTLIEICYRSTQDDNLQEKVATDLSLAFPGTSFKPSHVFIITWNDSISSSATNTRQAVFATDGTSSFVIFNLGKTETSDSRYKFSGFVNNNGVILNVIHPSADYNSHTAIITKETNMGIPGKWAFQVDQLEVVLPKTPLSDCTNDSYVVDIYENNILVVYHRCLDYLLCTLETLVNCNFGNSSVKGIMTSIGAACEIPAVKTAQILNVEVTIQAKSITLKQNVPVFVEPIFAYFYAEKKSEHNMKLSVIFTDFVRPTFLQVSVTLSILVVDQLEDSSWNESLLDDSDLDHACVYRYGFEKEFNISDISIVLRNSNNPRFIFRRQYRFKNGMSLTTQQFSDQGILGEVWKVLDKEKFAKFAKEKCEQWLETERHLSKDINTLKVLETCPKTASNAKGDLRFRSGPFPNRFIDTQRTLYLYSGAFYPRFVKQNDDFVRCVYQDKAIKIPQPSYYDDRPRLNCCQWSVNNTEMCQRFRKVQPSFSLSDSTYKPPQMAAVCGLGHVTSFGTLESFQLYTKHTPVWLAKYQNSQTKQAFEMQGHFVRLQETAFSVLQAVSIRVGNEQDFFMTIEFLTGSKTGDIGIKIQEHNDNVTELQYEAGSFKGLYRKSYHLTQFFTYDQRKNIPEMLLFSFKSGVSVFVTSFVEQDARWLSVAVQLPKLEANCSGTGYLFQHLQTLTGKRQSNDVSKNDSTFISELTSREISIRPQVPSRFKLSKCGNRKECMFDYSLTKNKNIALNTNAFVKILQNFLRKL